MTVSEELLHRIYDRLMESAVAEDVADAVLAACDGEAALRAWGGGTPPVVPHANAPEPAGTAYSGVFLTSLTVSGFRGIGRASTLRFCPGPGLHVVTGPNGCGKSSFVEGLEVLFTGRSRRLEERPVEWKKGWRNLHQSEPCEIKAVLHREGATHATELSRRWEQAQERYGEASTFVQDYGQAKIDFAATGWDVAVRFYQPMLCAVDFEDVVGKPSELYERLAGVLGLDEYRKVKELLGEVKKDLEATALQPEEALPSLLESLRASDHPNSARCLTALDTGRKPRDPAVVEEILASLAPADPIIDTLDALVKLDWPPLEKAETMAAELRASVKTVKDLQTSISQKALLVMRLLQNALELYEQEENQACPVCKSGQLDAQWHADAMARLEQLTCLSRDLSAAKEKLRRQTAEARSLIRPVPSCLQQKTDKVDTAQACAAWESWANAPLEDSPEGARNLADHFEEGVLNLEDAVRPVVNAAWDCLSELNAAWVSLAPQITSFCEYERAASKAASRCKLLRQAAKWFDDEIERVRSERFAPLAEKAQNTWEKLRYRSSVSLRELALGGRGTRRRVEVSLQVDGVKAGLGVLSQGEINAFALSMFLPRATRPESPFRFLVIDDPVQSMDSAKVDGLAQVLRDYARSHQVIVFTHDDRLSDALRRLGIRARIMRLDRNEGSVVTPHEVISPALTALKNARAIINDKSLGKDLQDRIIPGFYRMALEATFLDLAWGKLLKEGLTHTEIEAKLEQAKTLYVRAALAFFADRSAGNKVSDWITKKYGQAAADILAACNKGVHGSLNDAKNLIGIVESFIGELQTELQTERHSR